MIGTYTSATTKRLMKSRLSSRFRLRAVHLYVRMAARWPRIGSGQDFTWEDAQVGSRVHQLSLFGDAVSEEEAAGAGNADVCRNKRSLEAFDYRWESCRRVSLCSRGFLSWWEHGCVHFRVCSQKLQWYQQICAGG